MGEINHVDEFINAFILELLYELTNETHKPNIENVIEELEEFYAD